MPDDHQRWSDEIYRPAVKRTPERRSEFLTESDLTIHPVYNPHTVGSSELPGEYPFTRGIQPSMYRGRLWTMRQYAGFSTPEESNARYRYLMSQGQNGLSIAFDLPTQTGYDPDHEMARSEVGKVGVSIASLADMEALFDGIPLDKVTTSMTINSTAPILLALYLAVARKQGVSFDKLGGTTQNDVLKEYIARGTYIFPPAPSLRLTTDMFAFCAEYVPQWNTISVSGYHMREAGSTAPQEIAFTLANGIAYVQAAVDAGLDVDSFAGRISFFFASHNNLFEEAAKFRAARRMWAKIMRDRFHAKDPRSWMLRFHTQTAGVTLQAQQPDINVVRTTIQGLAAVLGGTQSLHVNSKDEALGLPTEDSATLALRTQQVLASESGVTETVDPLAGSYYVENLTTELENLANELIASIDAMGGASAAIEHGFQQQQIENSAYRHLGLVESNERIIVGVNANVSPKESTVDVLRLDPDAERRQVERIQRVRAIRDTAAVDRTLSHLAVAAADTDVNTMPALLACVEAYATIGEICDTLRDAFGTYRPPT